MFMLCGNGYIVDVGGGGAKRCLLFIRFFGIKELEGYNGY